MKGLWFMVEALLAGVILIAFLVTLRATFLSMSPQEEPSMEAYQILEELDSSGVLRSYAVANDYAGLNSRIAVYNYNHSVEICDHDGCAGEKPVAENVWAGSYMISGDSMPEPRVVNLYLWRSL